MRSAKTKEIEATVSRVGNGCHVIVPKDWLGKTVKVVLATAGVSRAK